MVMCFRSSFAVLVLYHSLFCLASLQAAEAKPVDFRKDIQPIFAAHCLNCHGPQKQKGGLRLDLAIPALSGGDSGPFLLAKAPEKSLLLQLLRHPDAEKRMPQGSPSLSDVQIATIRQWIVEGATWPVDDTKDPRKEHWSFKAVVRRPIPTLADGQGIQNPIDAFVLDRLQQNKLTINREASKASLLRRLKFDLLGLPPTPEELETFINDPDPKSYEKQVDRFLASPHFGERWARHWLDVVRFAESDGFETNQPRPNAWPYRDYVIAAFNADLPFDRFLMEQLAGDQLGADAATGFLVGGGYDRVKSPDIGLTLQQRADELNDMVNTSSTAFLGLTVGCARCHNHKFDPISHVDYHAMKAIFSGVQHGERTTSVTHSVERQQQADKLRQELQNLQSLRLLSEPLARVSPVAEKDPKPLPRLRSAINPKQNIEQFTPVEARFVRMVIEQTVDGAEPCIDEIEIYRGQETTNLALAKLGTKASASSLLPGHPIHQIEHLNDGRYGNGRSWISKEPGKGWVQLEFSKPETIDRIVWGRDREQQFRDRVPSKYRFEVALIPGQWQIVATSEDRRKITTPAQGLPNQGLSKEEQEALLLANREARLEERLRELTTNRPVYAGTFTKPEPIHRLHRGEVLQTRELVLPGALSEFGSSLSLTAATSDPERRLALAKWMTDPKHPLTARVIVNRLWQHHFGTGIVDTPSDFGLNGSKPSHPELLDYLASELVAGGWKLKRLHKMMVMSATYRQSSVVTPAGLAIDKDARWLWRYPPRRLEAEAIRDSILFVSGKLDTTMGGPGFDLFEPNNNYVKVYTPKKQFGPAEYRRMIYQSKPRMPLDDIFGLFDCPDGGQIAPKRTRSTTPLQALSLLNSGFILQQSKFFAARLATEAGNEPEAQIRRGFLLTMQREATPVEVKAARTLIQQHGLETFCRALLNANEFIYRD